MSAKVLVHVGTPKTGTSYLQDVLFQNRGLLSRNGILYPADRFDAHFLAALDLMRLPWGGLETEAVGAWDAPGRAGARLAGHRDHQPRDPGHRVARARSAAPSTRSASGRAPRSTWCSRVRDLVRQIPAEWQENVKHRSAISYAHFLEHDPRPEPRAAEIGAWFWGGAGAARHPGPVGRARCLPRTCTSSPCRAPGAPRDLLWQRFVEAFGLGDLRLDTHDERANPSLGVPETALLRRINRTGQRRDPRRPTTARWSASCSPTRRSRSGPSSRPARRAPRRSTSGPRASASWVAALRAAGVRRRRRSRRPAPRPTPPTFADPDHPRAAGQQRGPRRDQGTAARECPAPSGRGASARRGRGVARDPPGAVASACAARWCGGSRVGGCSMPTAARGAGARGRRSGRSSTWRSHRRPRRRAADHRHSAADGGGQLLAGDPGDQLGGDLGGDHPVEVGVVDRGGRDRHRRCRQLLLLDQCVTESSPRIMIRIALRTLGSARS